MATAAQVKAAKRADFHPAAAVKDKSVVIRFPRKRVSVTRAKIMTAAQFARILAAVRAGDHPKRDSVLVMLTFYCGLRPQECAGLKWQRNIFNSAGEVGDVLHVTEDIGKRCVEREIPMNAELRRALRALREERPDDIFVIHPIGTPRREKITRWAYEQCKPNTLVQQLRRLYREHGLVGCTSYSGRRTFITNLARNCHKANSSLRDVQKLAGHKSLETTAGYIELSENHHKLVDLVF